MSSTPFLSLAGAVAADGADFGVAAHYGDPFREQRALERGEAIVDLSNRGVITVTGLDRLTWLHSMASQRLDNLQPGESVEALFLDANGHVEHAVHLTDDGETTWLIVEGSEVPALANFLDSMRFMLRVAVVDRSADYGVLAASSVATLDAATVQVKPSSAIAVDWHDPWATPTGHQYATGLSNHPAQSWKWVERVIERGVLSSVLPALGGGQTGVSGALAAEALRIAAWRPRFATEVDAKTLPHELDWLRTAVDLNKGCYRGQETVAKVLNLGRPPRRLTMLHLDGSDTILPTAGDVISGEKLRPEPPPGQKPERKVVGRITSVAMHHELGPIALAVITRAVPATLPLVVTATGGEVAAAQVEIVPHDAGAALEVPRLPRLGIRKV